MKICEFCGKNEIPLCKYNNSRQNCCGADSCVIARRKLYQERRKDEGYWKKSKVRDRTNEVRRARRRTFVFSLLPLILMACADKLKRIIDPLVKSDGCLGQVVMNKLIRAVLNAAGIAVGGGLNMSN